MKEFKEYVQTGIVKTRSENTARVKSIIDEAEKRLRFFNNVKVTEESANYIIENMYDAVRELIEAKLLIDGYKSYSHEATVSYLKILGIANSETEFMDELRTIRNQTKYYGHLVNSEYAKKVSEFANSIFPKLKKMIEIK